MKRFLRKVWDTYDPLIILTSHVIALLLALPWLVKFYVAYAAWVGVIE